MLAQDRANPREWVKERRARTRHLIELGGLVQKAGLVDLLEDDRATLFGILLEAAEQLRTGGPEGKDAASLKALWKRRGMRVFEAEKDASST